MLKEIFSFEVRYHLRQPLFYISTIIFFLLTFGAVTTDSVMIGGAIGNVNRNAPFVIMQVMAIMSIIGVFITTAFVANAIHRDFEHNTASLFFTSPITKLHYLGGRFLGSTLISFLVFIGVTAAFMIGSLMPWLEKERIGAFSLEPYLFSLFVLVLPNIILTAAVFFGLAAITRSMIATYAGVVAFFVGYMIAANLLVDVENDLLASLLDPFGMAAFTIATKYWTVFQRNNSVLAMEAPLLLNRLIWLAVSAIVLLVTYRRFRFTAVVEHRKSPKAKKAVDGENVVPLSRAWSIPDAVRTFGSGASFRQYAHQSRVEIAGVVRSIPFLVMLALGAMNIIGNSFGMDEIFGTTVYPVTGLMLRLIENSFLLFALIILTFFSGELVFRERQLKLNEVYDALPLPSWVMWSAKLTALVAALVVLLTTAMLTSIVVQLVRGYSNLELPLYFKGLFLQVGVPFLLIAVLAIVLQVLTNNKYVGFLAMVLFFISGMVLPAMGFEHNLYQIIGAPNAVYSDMNGYGHFVRPLVWFYLYWTFFCAAILTVAHLLWVRGTESSWKKRLAMARQRFGRPALAVAGGSLVAFAATGCFIYYNTNVLNHYETGKDRERKAAEFEKLYKKYERFPQPRITAVKTDVDIYPAERRVEMRGTYTVENRTAQPIRELHVTMRPDVKRRKLRLPAHRVVSDDREHGYAIYELKRPLAPGERAEVGFDLAIENPGFVNNDSNVNVVANGTFFNSEYYPHFGYVDYLELQDRAKRKKHGLKPVVRAAKMTDMRARMNNYISRDTDWMDFETTVSTSPGQIALAPGYLQKEWTANGRRYFHYKMDSPILGFFAFLSADYQVKRDRWKNVDIEIYYDSKHPYNVDRMIYGVKRSLEYFTKNFGPYQHHQVRIVEFPRYARFAQSFPNTIPFSESIGFIADLRKEEAIDYVFYVTAHEVAHQWWAHQVIGGDVQGSTMLSETLSQYSALMVMEKEYGRDKMRRFLKYELDAYLRGRGGELVEEMPLLLVENQPYVHYRKGSLAMYALRDNIGEERVNAALREQIAATAFQQPPYTTSRELYDRFRKVTPPPQQPFLADLFERIILYENRATAVSSKRRADGRYAVSIDVESRKVRYDGAGRESEVSLDEWIDVGVFAPEKKKGEERLLALQRVHVTAPKSHFEIVVNEPPGKAGIDPLNKLIDRNPEDNVKPAETPES